MLEYRNKVLFVGYGPWRNAPSPFWSSTSKCRARHHGHGLRRPPCRVGAVAEARVKFVHKRVTRDNMNALLGKYLEAGDLLIDLAWNIDCCESSSGAMTGASSTSTLHRAVGPYENAKHAPPQKMTLYWRQMKSPP